VVRRTRFDLKKAEEREHILAGLVIALDNIDRVIAIIRGSSTPPDAKTSLMSDFAFTDVQAQAILDMRLQRLTSLESNKLREEREEVLATIAKLREILGSEQLVLDIISNELREIKEQYGDKRRTEIIAEASEITIEDMIADEDMVITVSRGGYIKRSPLSLYRAQRRGGKGRIGMQTKEEDIVEHLFVASTHAYVLVFTDRGRLYWLKVHAIPEVASNARGKAIVNLLPVESGESVRALLTTRDFTEGKYVVMATRGGKIKKTELSAFSNVRSTGIMAIDIAEGDDLYAVRLSDGNSDIFVGKAGGQVIRFNEDEVRPMGRGAAGVRAVMLREDDHVVEMDVLPAGAITDDESDVESDTEGDESAEIAPDSRGYVFTVTENGYGKRTPVSAYPTKHRAGYGVIDIKTNERNGKVAGMAVVFEEDQVLLITEQGMILRVPVSSIPIKGRNILGVRIVRTEENDRVVAAIKLVEKESPEENGEAAPEEPEPVH
jgi:DNA gyrase subunit A